AHLLPPVRAPQSRGVAWHVLAIVLGLAVLVLWFRGGARRGRTVAVILATCWLFVAWAYLLARYATLNWAASYFSPGFAVRGRLRHHQRGRQLFRRGLCSRGAAAGLDRPCPQLAIATPGPGRGRRGWALHLCLCAIRLAAGRPPSRSAVAAGRDLRHCAGSHR